MRKIQVYVPSCTSSNTVVKLACLASHIYMWFLIQRLGIRTVIWLKFVVFCSLYLWMLTLIKKICKLTSDTERRVILFGRRKQNVANWLFSLYLSLPTVLNTSSLFVYFHYKKQQLSNHFFLDMPFTYPSEQTTFLPFRSGVLQPNGFYSLEHVYFCSRVNVATLVTGWVHHNTLQQMGVTG